MKYDAVEDLRRFEIYGYNSTRQKRYESPFVLKLKDTLICTECGTAFEYPFDEVHNGLVDPKTALNYCSRVCWNKSMMRFDKYDKDCK